MIFLFGFIISGCKITLFFHTVNILKFSNESMNMRSDIAELKGGKMIRKVVIWAKLSIASISVVRLKPIDVSLYQVSLPFPAYNSVENKFWFSRVQKYN
jgi:hypothetical protein